MQNNKNVLTIVLVLVIGVVIGYMAGGMNNKNTKVAQTEQQGAVAKTQTVYKIPNPFNLDLNNPLNNSKATMDSVVKAADSRLSIAKTLPVSVINGGGISGRQWAAGQCEISYWGLTVGYNSTTWNLGNPGISPSGVSYTSYYLGGGFFAYCSE